MPDLATIGGFVLLALYITWREIIPWLLKRGDRNGRTMGCRAGDVLAIMNRQTEILSELKQGNKEMHEAVVKLVTLAESADRRRGASC